MVTKATNKICNSQFFSLSLHPLNILLYANNMIDEYSVDISSCLIEYIKENCTNYYVEEPHYRGVELINLEELLQILGDKNNEYNYDIDKIYYVPHFCQLFF